MFECLCAGKASLFCASISIGGLSALDEPLAAVVVQSPSSHCNRLLATADLHAAASRVQTKPAKTPKSFLVVKFGRGSANSENSASRRSGKEALLWEMRQPSGMEIDVEAAGIEVSVSIKLHPWHIIQLFIEELQMPAAFAWCSHPSPALRSNSAASAL